MGHSCSSLSKTKSKSHSAIPEQTLNVNAPAQLLVLPPLLFTNPAHFIEHASIIARSKKHTNLWKHAIISSVLLQTPITKGIVSVTMTTLSLPMLALSGEIIFGLLDSTAPVPKFGEELGLTVNDSLSLLSVTGWLYRNTPSTQHTPHYTSCHSELREGDCVRMEVDMDSNPRTVQFFVNGESGESFVSGLPPSVRIGFTIYGLETSFRIDKITQQEKPTPIAPEMEQIQW
ncbi:hypothetical protein BLNAU_23120 [Blattamonas nauphoetae]|uniref:SPRY domain-containing protein n=1 Tax=Blattamonas nauphoetae TaxID=2049346 RepID=A0ABQ9WTB9_9EUKA|nr:hypothetical protein BLNAU_23120 [Blattamonas nauphoetae]